MKLLSFVVPCFNSENYMMHCIETLLTGGDEVEIWIIDDGSKDHTGEIADDLSVKYPDIIHVVHQENRGHGGALMCGIEHATAPYIKVVDSDDWLDTDALKKVLDVLRVMENKKHVDLDLLICNYVYDKFGQTHHKVMHYRHILPQDTIFTWEEARHFPKGKYILMHSVIYRTQLLKDCGMHLPDHTFYVDNLFVYVPMVKVNTMYYMDVDLYHYFIGRSDQSVNESIMIKRIDQQIKVNKLMLEQVDLRTIVNKHQKQYMYNYLEIITTISSVLLMKAGDEENLKKKDALWQYIHDEYPWIYKKLKHGFFGTFVSTKGPKMRKVVIIVYKISQKIFGFN